MLLCSPRNFYSIASCLDMKAHYFLSFFTFFTFLDCFVYLASPTGLEPVFTSLEGRGTIQLYHGEKEKEKVCCGHHAELYVTKYSTFQRLVNGWLFF